jgi:hypothetical protein
MFPFLPRLSDRIQWILTNREKTATGRPMKPSALAVSAGLSRPHIWQLVNDPARTDVTTATAQAIAWAGQVSRNWLDTGRGSPDDPDIPEAPPPPKPKHQQRAQPGTFGAYSNWAEVLDEAFKSKKGIHPPEACLAGADLPVPKGRVIERLTPELVRTACEFAWNTLSENKQGEYVDQWVREEKRRALETRQSVAPRAKSLRETGGFPKRR